MGETLLRTAAGHPRFVLGVESASKSCLNQRSGSFFEQQYRTAVSGQSPRIHRG